jgi:hypothetical protein
MKRKCKLPVIALGVSINTASGKNESGLEGFPRGVPLELVVFWVSESA